MHNIYLLQKFVLDYMVMLARDSTPGRSILDLEKESKNDTILCYKAIRSSPLLKTRNTLHLLRVLITKIVPFSRRQINTVNSVTVTCFTTKNHSSYCKPWKRTLWRSRILVKLLKIYSKSIKFTRSHGY